MVAWNVSKCDSSEFRVVLERNHMWWHGMLASVVHLNAGSFCCMLSVQVFFTLQLRM